MLFQFSKMVVYHWTPRDGCPVKWLRFHLRCLHPMPDFLRSTFQLCLQFQLPVNVYSEREQRWL